jgi:hypothetical protein
MVAVSSDSLYRPFRTFFWHVILIVSNSPYRARLLSSAFAVAASLNAAGPSIMVFARRRRVRTFRPIDHTLGFLLSALAEPALAKVMAVFGQPGVEHGWETALHRSALT